LAAEIAVLMDHDTFRRLCRAREALTEMECEQLPLKDVARDAGMSLFHFIRRFNALFGMTPHQYRINLRINRAKLLLATESHSVTDVCMDVGFESLGSFSDLFTRRVGIAPSHYQRTARTLVQIPNDLPQPLFPGCLRLIAYLPAGAFRNFREASARIAG
jgi:AraC-like DNA-binding protein